MRLNSNDHYNMMYPRTRVRGAKRAVALIFLIAMVLSQAIPTFGTSIGFIGNLIPIAVSGSLAIVSIILTLIISEIRLPRSAIFFLTVVCLFVPFVMLIGHVFFSPVTPQSITDIIKPLLLGLFFVSGIAAAQVSRGDSGILIYVIISSFLINLFLLFIFFIDTNSAILELYRTRVIGGVSLGRARFVGVWNFPYNLTVFVVAFYCFAFFSLGRKTPDFIGRFMYFSFSGLALLMILMSQSRMALFATAICTLGLLLALSSSRSLGFKGVSSIGSRKVFSGVGIVIIVFVFIVWRNPDVVEIYTSRLFNLFDSQDGSLTQSARFGRFDRYVSAVESNIIGLFFGFSTSSSAFSGGPYESTADYFVRYGLLGGAGFYFFPLFFAILVGLRGLKSRSTDRPEIFVFLIFLAVSALLHFTTTIFYHFRFIPIFGFCLGFCAWLSFSGATRRSYSNTNTIEAISPSSSGADEGGVVKE